MFAKQRTVSSPKHPWRHTIKAFLNLEASGGGGKEILFQVSRGHGWLVDAYRRSARHPNAQSIGNVIFSSGIIPSLTDFTVYTDYGGVPGVDFAFSENGYVYHTQKDNLDSVDVGALQHCGDNVLSLILTLNNGVRHKPLGEGDNQDHVFYDVFGFIMVSYSYATATKLHILLIAAFGVLLWKVMQTYQRQVLFTFIFRLVVGNVCGCLSALLTGVLSYMLTGMRFFSHPKMALPTFGLPVVIAIVLVHHMFNARSRLDVKLSQLQLETYVVCADGLLWYFNLTVVTLCCVGISPMVVFFNIAFLLTLVLRMVLLKRLGRHKYYIYDILHCALFLMPIAVIQVLLLKVLDVFVPIMGRGGH